MIGQRTAFNHEKTHTIYSTIKDIETIYIRKLKMQFMKIKNVRPEPITTTKLQVFNVGQARKTCGGVKGQKIETRMCQ